MLALIAISLATGTKSAARGEAAAHCDIVSQSGSDSDCGFGHGVYCSGTYRLKSRKPPKLEQR